MQNKKNTKKYVYGFMALAALATLATANPALADATAPTGGPNNGAYAGQPHAWGGTGHMNVGARGMMKPGVFGTVSAVSGNIITVTSTHRTGPTAAGSTTTTTPTTTTYTVDATNATVTKDNATSAVGSIAVGDTIMAQGTLTGTNLVATTIRDGLTMRVPGSNGGQTGTGQNQTSPITGNGQPVVAGTVSALNGNTLTMTNKSNVTYTVDITNAKIVQGQTTISVSNIVVGDNVIVQGTVNGTSITASSVIDLKAGSTGATAAGTTTPQPKKGFFGAIGSFFSHIFGF